MLLAMPRALGAQLPELPAHPVALPLWPRAPGAPCCTRALGALPTVAVSPCQAMSTRCSETPCTACQATDAPPSGGRGTRYPRKEGVRERKEGGRGGRERRKTRPGDGASRRSQVYQTIRYQSELYLPVVVGDDEGMSDALVAGGGGGVGRSGHPGGNDLVDHCQLLS